MRVIVVAPIFAATRISHPAFPSRSTQIAEKTRTPSPACTIGWEPCQEKWTYINSFWRIRIHVSEFGELAIFVTKQTYCAPAVSIYSSRTSWVAVPRGWGRDSFFPWARTIENEMRQAWACRQSASIPCNRRASSLEISGRG